MKLQSNVACCIVAKTLQGKTYLDDRRSVRIINNLDLQHTDPYTFHSYAYRFKLCFFDAPASCERRLRITGSAAVPHLCLCQVACEECF